MKIKYQAGTVMPDEYDYVRDFNALDTTIPYTEMDTGKVLGLAIAHQQKDAEIAELVKFIDEWKEYLPEYEAEEKARELTNKYKKNPPVKEG